MSEEDGPSRHTWWPLAMPVVDWSKVSVCYHEGAHAVVAVREGHPVDHVEVWPERGGYAGITRHRRLEHLDFESRAWAERRGSVIAAGPLVGVFFDPDQRDADEVLFDGGDGICFPDECIEDELMLKALARHLRLGRRGNNPAVQRWVVGRTRRANEMLFEVDPDGDALHRVARALYEDERLSGDQVRDLVVATEIARLELDQVDEPATDLAGDLWEVEHQDCEIVLE